MNKVYLCRKLLRQPGYRWCHCEQIVQAMFVWMKESFPSLPSEGAALLPFSLQLPPHWSVLHNLAYDLPLIGFTLPAVFLMYSLITPRLFSLVWLEELVLDRSLAGHVEPNCTWDPLQLWSQSRIISYLLIFLPCFSRRYLDELWWSHLVHQVTSSQIN